MSKKEVGEPTGNPTLTFSFVETIIVLPPLSITNNHAATRNTTTRHYHHHPHDTSIISTMATDITIFGTDAYGY